MAVLCVGLVTPVSVRNRPHSSLITFRPRTTHAGSRSSSCTIPLFPFSPCPIHPHHHRQPNYPGSQERSLVFGPPGCRRRNQSINAPAAVFDLKNAHVCRCRARCGDAGVLRLGPMRLTSSGDVQSGFRSLEVVVGDVFRERQSGVSLVRVRV